MGSSERFRSSESSIWKKYFKKKKHVSKVQGRREQRKKRALGRHWQHFWGAGIGAGVVALQGQDHSAGNRPRGSERVGCRRDAVGEASSVRAVCTRSSSRAMGRQAKQGWRKCTKVHFQKWGEAFGVWAKRRAKTEAGLLVLSSQSSCQWDSPGP